MLNFTSTWASPGGVSLCVGLINKPGSDVCCKTLTVIDVLNCDNATHSNSLKTRFPSVSAARIENPHTYLLTCRRISYVVGKFCLVRPRGGMEKPSLLNKK